MLYHKIKEFDDGTRIEPADHVSIFYIKGEYVVGISPNYSWFSLLPFVKSKIQIDKNSLIYWQEYPIGSSKTITKKEKEDITNKLEIYFGDDFDGIQ